MNPWNKSGIRKYWLPRILFLGPYIAIWGMWDKAEFYLKAYLPKIGIEANNSFEELFLAEIIPNIFIGLPILFIICLHLGLINYFFGFRYNNINFLWFYGALICLIYIFLYILLPLIYWIK